MAGEGQSQAKERNRAVGRGDGPAGKRVWPWVILLLSLLQHSGKALVLLCTILWFTLTIFFLESLKQKKWCFVPPVLGLHFLIVKIFDGL